MEPVIGIGICDGVYLMEHGLRRDIGIGVVTLSVFWNGLWNVIQ